MRCSHESLRIPTVQPVRQNPERYSSKHHHQVLACRALSDIGCEAPASVTIRALNSLGMEIWANSFDSEFEGTEQHPTNYGGAIPSAKVIASINGATLWQV